MTSPEQDSTKLPEHLNKHRVAKALTQLGVTSVMYTLALMSPESSIRKLRDPARTSGLIGGAILANPLCFPDTQRGLVYHRVSGGLWGAWDGMRQNEFPVSKFEAKDIVREGKIAFFYPENLRDNPPDKRTPVGAVQITNIDNILTFNTAGPEKLVELGLAQNVTYEEAYSNLGVEEMFKDDLHKRGIAEAQVWQITPKGNTLVYLTPPMGSPAPKRATEGAKVPGFLPGVA